MSGAEAGGVAGRAFGAGVLGASVHLDSLGELLKEQMGGLEDRLIFFAIDSTPIGALQEMLMYSSSVVIIDTQRQPKQIVTKIDLVDWLCKNVKN
mgnify:CR=1 FL=1